MSSHIFTNKSLMTQNHMPQEDDTINSHSNTYFISILEVWGSYSEVLNTLFIIDASSQSGRVFSLAHNYPEICCIRKYVMTGSLFNFMNSTDLSCCYKEAMVKYTLPD